jgi:hypothetical protein
MMRQASANFRYHPLDAATVAERRRISAHVAQPGTVAEQRCDLGHDLFTGHGTR